MPNNQPRPEYGEYATPEEQARAAGLEYVPPSQRPAPAPVVRADDVEDAAPRRSPVDRYITLLFLIFGAITLLESINGDLHFAGQLKDFATGLGVSSVAIPAGVQSAGYWLLAANVVLFSGTVALAMFALSRQKISFYIPIVGFFVYLIVYSIILNAAVPDLIRQVGNHVLQVSG